MPIEHDLDPTDALCPHCRETLFVDRYDRYWCRDCGEQQYPPAV